MISVLLVDDDRALRGELRRALEAAGYRVREADNGALALNVFRDDAPDIVVTDIVMAESEGIEFIRMLRRDAPDLPILAISGNPRYLGFSRKLGASATLLKPFGAKTLLRHVEAAL